MRAATERLWASQNRHEGDRERLFGAVAGTVRASTVLYPGSFVDVAPSFVWPSVTYVDTDRRAERFFDDEAGVAEILADNGIASGERSIHFIHGDYTADLPLEDGSFDLLVSLYAGFVSESCTRYLRIGGSLLVNPSHGDVAMVSIDDRYRLSGVVRSRSGRYSVVGDDLDTYLIPKRDVELTADQLRVSRRGVAYTKSPFAYLFERVG